MTMFLVSTFLCLCFVSYLSFTSSAVIGLDLGTEFMKLFMVSPGSGFQIVLNEQSKRKTNVIVAFEGNETYCGGAGETVRLQSPKRAFSNLKLFIGRAYNETMIQSLLEKPYQIPYSITQDKNRTNGFMFNYEAENNQLYQFTPEELLAVYLRYAVSLTSLRSKLAIVDDIVLTAPSSFTQAQKQALLDAAEMVDLRVTDIIDENTAAAIQLGINTIPQKPRHVLFYNLGASHLQVSIVKYSNMTIPESIYSRKNKTIGNIEILAKTWDDTLGANVFEENLAIYLANEFNEKLLQNKEDVKQNLRAFTKIQSSAKRTKIILSANKEIPVNMPTVYKNYDLKAHMTRDKFEEINADLYPRAMKPVEDALKIAGLSANDIDDIEIIGGGTRMKKIQHLLKERFNGRTLAVHLNGDEAMAQGASFRAANISSAFRNRLVGITDITPYSIGARLTNLKLEESTDEKPWVKRAALFAPNHALNTKKSVSFTHVKDILCSFKYDNPSLLGEGVTSNISQYEITGIEDFIKQMSSKNVTTPKIGLTFYLDSKGMVSIARAEATIEESMMIQVPVKADANTTKAANSTKQSADSTNEANSTKEDNDLTKDSETDETNETSKEIQTEEKIVTKTHSRDLVIKRIDFEDDTGLTPLNEERKKKGRQVIYDLAEMDRIVKENVAAKNELESFIYDAKDKLDNEVVKEVTKEDDLKKLVDELSDLGQWLYEEGYEASARTYKEKYNQYKANVDAILFRKKEYTQRPEALEDAATALAKGKSTIEDWTMEKPHITEEEKNEVQDKITELEEWMEKKKKEQQSLPGYEEPVFTSDEIKKKVKAIEKMISKLEKKPIEPKKKPVKVNETEEAAANTTGEVKDKNSTNANTKEHEEVIVKEDGEIQVEDKEEPEEKVVEKNEETNDEL